jgi:hypothetical protein
MRLIQKYVDLQRDGIYHYAVNVEYGGFRLWWEHCPCKVFARLNRYCSQNPRKRSNPLLLAFVELYAPKDIKIEVSDAPEYVTFSEYDGWESISSSKAERQREHERWAEQQRVEQQQRTKLSNAKQLASSLAAKIEDADSSAMIDQLIQVLNSMVV